MNIELDKVTWFSKLLASGLLMFGLLIAFLAGMGHQNAVNQTYSPINIDSSKKIFRSEKYGFQLVYPSDYLLIAPETEDIPINYIGMCGSDPAVCVVYKGPESSNPNFGGAALIVEGHSTAVNTESRCAAFIGSNQKVTINGRIFNFRKGRPMMMGGFFDYEDDYLYSTFRNSTCYVVGYGVNSIGQRISQIDKEKIITALQKIVKTFRFID